MFKKELHLSCGVGCLVLISWLTYGSMRKKTKGVSSSTAEPPSEYDKEKFVSFAAQKKYVKSFMKRGVIQKRGLYVTMDSVAKQVEKRKWEELIKHPEAVVVPVVREFYANMEEHRDFRVSVRGK